MPRGAPYRETVATTRPPGQEAPPGPEWMPCLSHFFPACATFPWQAELGRLLIQSGSAALEEFGGGTHPRSRGFCPVGGFMVDRRRGMDLLEGVVLSAAIWLSVAPNLMCQQLRMHDSS